MAPKVLGMELGQRNRPRPRRRLFIALFAAATVATLATLLGRHAYAQAMIANSTVIDPNSLPAGTLPSVTYVKDARNGVICYVYVPIGSLQVTGDAISCVKVTSLSLTLP